VTVAEGHGRVEALHGERFATREQAKAHVFEYIFERLPQFLSTVATTVGHFPIR
jgi:hypothetical protein